MLRRLWNRLRTLGANILGKTSLLRVKAMARTEGKDEALVESSMDLFGWVDGGEPLPFVQLGDVFVKDHRNLVFAVINASCDLQIVPEGVSAARKKSGRTRGREDSVLLLPGRVCEIGDTSSSLTTELFPIDNKYYAIEWNAKQIVAVPQCHLREVLESRGYSHDVRLRMDRAIELQQEAFASNARVGLDVQPQLSRAVSMRLFVKVAGEFKPLGDDVTLAGGVFHTRSNNVLVLTHDCVMEIRRRLSEEEHADIATGKKQFMEVYSLLFKCPFAAQRASHLTLKVLKPNNATTSCKKIRVGFSDCAVTPDKTTDAQIYFHFFRSSKVR